MNDLLEKLHLYYADNSKHANYQNVPEFVRAKLGYQERIDENWRGDAARYAFVQQYAAFRQGDRIGDVGANTGFFVLSLAHAHPESAFTAYEINPRHVDFIRLVVDAFGMNNVDVEPLGLDMAGVDAIAETDMLLHLNVLHHAGHDFDKELVDEAAGMSGYAIRYLRKLAQKTRRIVFQIGYNWGGDKSQPIIDPHDQVAMVAWLKRIFGASGWEIEVMAFATRNAVGDVVYLPLPTPLVAGGSTEDASADAEEVTRALDAYSLSQFPGEFYRRPIVICRSLSKRA